MIRSRRVVTHSRKQPSNRLPDLVVEGAILLEQLHAAGVLHEVATRLQVRREGGYHGLDVVVFLVLLFAARRRLSIKEFGAVTSAARPALAALASRRNLPSPASVSRFLSAVDDAALAPVIPWLLLEGAQALDCLKHESVMARDCQGERWHIFDFDPTVTALRQRALPEGDDLPRAQRHSHEARPGYPGRKRGDVQVSRATLQHAGSSLWLGIWSQPGNGSWRSSSAAAIDTVVRTCRALGHDTRRALIRVDGAAGNTPFIAACNAADVSYVTRSAHYQMLQERDVRQHLEHTTWFAVEDSRSGPRRQAAELGEHVLSSRSIDDEGKPFEPVRSRVVVSRYQTDQPRGAGWFEAGWHYELFLTSVSADAMPAPEVVTCYYQRTGIENRFHQEDRELGLDRIFSYHIPGQNLASLVALFVWNLRVCGGFALVDAPPPVPAQVPRVAEPVAVAPASTPRDGEGAATTSESAQECITPPASATTREDERRQALAKLDWPTSVVGHPGWSWDIEAMSMTCPAGKIAELSTIDTDISNAHGRVRFRVSSMHCRSCPQRTNCTSSTDPTYRKQASIRIPTATAEALKVTLSEPSRAGRRHIDSEQVPTRPREPHWTPPAAVTTSTLLAFVYALLLPAKLRRMFVDACQAVEVHIELTPAAAPPAPCPVYAVTPGQRQNRRLTWAETIARNALPSTATVAIIIASSDDAPKRLLSRTSDRPSTSRTA